MSKDRSKIADDAVATVVPAWETNANASVRLAKNLRISRKEYVREVENIANACEDQVRGLLDGLNPYERKWVMDILLDLRDATDTRSAFAYNSIWEADYDDRPVTIDQFIEDDYYLGSAATLFPKWQEELKHVLRPGTNCLEWHLGGSIGSGKSYTAMVGMAYLLHRMLC